MQRKLYCPLKFGLRAFQLLLDFVQLLAVLSFFQQCKGLGFFQLPAILMHHLLVFLGLGAGALLQLLQAVLIAAPLRLRLVLGPIQRFRDLLLEGIEGSIPLNYTPKNIFVVLLSVEREFHPKTPEKVFSKKTSYFLVAQPLLQLPDRLAFLEDGLLFLGRHLFQHAYAVF